MWHIELVKNKYESLEDLYSLLQYVFRLNKTADDSRRANIITDDLTGCLPAMIPDINNPDMVYRLMLFIIQRRHKDTPQLVRHRIVSFQASDCILPQDCNGVQREHNKKLNNGLPILHKVPPKRDYGRYFCIMAEKGGTSHGGLTEKLSPFFHAKKQEVNAYGR